MRRLSFPLAIAAAAILGGAAFLGLLPWGDPCTFTTPPGEPGCAIIFSPLQQDIRNAGFGGVCLLIGFIAGLLTRSYRLIAGALSTLAAVFVAHFAGHGIYGIGWPQHPMPWTSSTILTTSGFMAAFAAIGLIGAALSDYVRLTNARSGVMHRNKRLYPGAQAHR